MGAESSQRYRVPTGKITRALPAVDDARGVMENEPAPADRPYLRPLEPPFFERIKWWVNLAVILAGGVGAYYFWQQDQDARVPVSPPHAESPPAAPVVSEVPPIRYPLERTGARLAQAGLPALQDSDALASAALKGLLDDSPLLDLFYPDRIIPRVVATIDNLPRKAAPARMMPVKPVPGMFATARTGITPVIAPVNSVRYRPYVRLAQSVDAVKLVDLYVRFYPLFQKGYAELGYPKGHFNDRLIEAIDDLLEAPAAMTPVRLAQPKVLYQFEADDLEGRSAGQKILIRMGSANAATVKAKLREIRAVLITRVAKR